MYGNSSGSYFSRNASTSQYWLVALGFFVFFFGKYMLCFNYSRSLNVIFCICMYYVFFMLTSVVEGINNASNSLAIDCVSSYRCIL